MNCSPVMGILVLGSVVVAMLASSIMRSRVQTGPSNGPGHRFELDDGAVLLLGQVLAPLLDVDVVPGEDLVDRPLPLAVEGDVDAEVLEGLPPELGIEVFGPGVEPGPASPGLLEPGGDAAVAPGQDAFEQAPLDVVALDRDRADPDPRAEVLVRPAEVLAGLHPVPLVGRVRLG